MDITIIIVIIVFNDIIIDIIKSRSVDGMVIIIVIICIDRIIVIILI